MSGRPRLLDLICGAGGAGVGYSRAGFDVTGCDLVVSPRSPHPVIEADALALCPDWIAANFDAVHASPPCQRYSRMTGAQGPQARGKHPDLVGPTREMLQRTGLHYVIENVPGAPMILPLTLCGSMFSGLRVRRHRLFETNWPLPSVRCGTHQRVYDHCSKKNWRKLKSGEVDAWSVWLTASGQPPMIEAHMDAMQIDWMNGKELVQAIPPDYTNWIGRHLMEQLT